MKHFKEEYHSLAPSPYDKSKAYPILINPLPDEIRKFSRETNSARFIAHDNNLYLFHAELLHQHAIKHLGLPISNDPPIHQAFMGIAKPNHDGTLAFKETNQKITSPTAIQKHHSSILHYFK